MTRAIPEELEPEALALRRLHEKLRDRLEGHSLGDRVARSWCRFARRWSRAPTFKAQGNGAAQSASCLLRLSGN